MSVLHRGLTRLILRRSFTLTFQGSWDSQHRTKATDRGRKDRRPQIRGPTLLCLSIQSAKQENPKQKQPKVLCLCQIRVQ